MVRRPGRVGPGVTMGVTRASLGPTIRTAGRRIEWASVGSVRAWMADLGLGVLVRWGLVIAVAIHPFSILYGANGMSEAGMGSGVRSWMR